MSERGDSAYEADIRWTTHGVAHITARTWGDLGFGQGYACARDHLPTIADQFEREANNFARYALFQGAAYKEMAADMPMAVKTPITLSKKFGASVYASAREFARTNHRACLVYILEPIHLVPGVLAYADVRRIEASPSFAQQFGIPTAERINVLHALGALLPIGRKMTRPTQLVYSDRNGVAHECLGEAFDTTHNVLLLIYPTRALNGSLIALPERYQGLLGR